MKPAELLSIISRAGMLKTTYRHCYTEDDRRESVADHSWRIALMAMLLSGEEEFRSVDMDRVIRMCLIHDLGEAFTGDIPTFRKSDEDAVIEDGLFLKWVGSFPEAQRSEWEALLSEMDAMDTVEARTYKALDKLEAVISHNESDIRTWLPLEYELQLTYGAENVQFSAYLKELKAQVDKWTIEKIENEKEVSCMQIKAVKLYENGFMTQGLAFGGEGMDGIDPSMKYRSSLQNYVIDTGNEVILVDTGMPAEVPEQVPDEKTMIYMGKKVKNYVDALAEAGYKPEQVSKILITHKHADHTGELRNFPNARILAARVECDADELKPYSNVEPVDFTDGPYKNFPASQKIADGVYYIPAKGHTNGNSIVIVENDGLYYMIHGDVTYTDEALYQNKLSIVFEDVAAARETLDAVREFIRNNPTVYLSTHTPLGYENLENKKVVDLDNMPEPIPVGEIEAAEATGKYVCSVCGYVYDPAEHDGVAFEDLPDDWKCPRCKQPKEKFNKA